MEQIADHVNAAVLDIGGLRILLVIDKVLGEGLCHELLGFIFLKTGVSEAIQKCYSGVALCMGWCCSACHPPVKPRNGSVSAMSGGKIDDILGMK